MYVLLIRLILIAAMLDLGLSLTDLHDPRKKETASRKVIDIPWKPISVFTEEAQRFR